MSFNQDPFLGSYGETSGVAAAIAEINEKAFFVDGSKSMEGPISMGSNIIIGSNAVEFNEVATGATPPAGDISLYAKTDGELYMKDDAGVETLVSGSGGDFVGPGSSVVNNLVSFANTTGKLGADSAILASSIAIGAGSSVTGNVASFANGTGKLLQDSAKAAADLVTSSNWATNEAIVVSDVVGTNALKESAVTVNSGVMSNVVAVKLDEDSNNATYYGFEAGNVSSGGHNTGVGDSALLLSSTGGSNTALGSGALDKIVLGTDNIGIGRGAGAFLTSNESNNILISHKGVVTESATIRIGTVGQHTGGTFVAGIHNATPGGTAEMVTIDSDGELGSATIPAGGSGDVSASINFANDNRLITSDGAGTKNVQQSGVTVSGTTVSDILILVAKAHRFEEVSGPNYIEIYAPALGSNYTLLLPPAQATSNSREGLVNYNGVLQWGGTPYPPGYLDGGGMHWVSDSSVNVMSVNCRDSTDTHNIVLGSNALLNLAVTGSAGGMQVAESSSTMYAVYVISDSTGVTATNSWGVPQGTAISLPSGFDSYRFMGSIRNDSGSNLLRFEYHGKGRMRHYHYVESRATLEVYDGSGTAGVFTNLDLGDLIPAGVDMADFSIELDMDADSHKFYMQSGINPQSVANALMVHGGGIQAADFQFADFMIYNQALDPTGGTGSQPSVEWATDVTGQDAQISVSSYTQNL